MLFLYGLGVGILVGGALSYLYAAKVIADFKKLYGIVGNVKKAL